MPICLCRHGFGCVLQNRDTLTIDLLQPRAVPFCVCAPIARTTILKVTDFYAFAHLFQASRQSLYQVHFDVKIDW